ncbi:MAG: response regulator [Gammaproteobacteria bacterium]|nr:response regulator [Gammaproteobacteria bacterium]
MQRLMRGLSSGEQPPATPTAVQIENRCLKAENGQLRHDLQTAVQTIDDLKKQLDIQAREHEKTVGTFLHVFNNPMHGIEGHTELLTSGLSDLRKTVEKGSQDIPADSVQQALLEKLCHTVREMSEHLDTVKGCASQQARATHTMLGDYQRKISQNTVSSPPASLRATPFFALAPSIPQRVLVVDDESINRKLALKQLEKGMYNTDSADNGEEAVAKWQAAIHGGIPYDAIIMDVIMPVLDGLKATQAIRQYESEQGLQPVYIIGLSANALDQHKREAFQNGMDAYLTKPCDAQTLLAAVANKTIPGPASNTSSSPEMAGDDDLRLEAINGFSIYEYDRSSTRP